jgi:hypothetical protein
MPLQKDFTDNSGVVSSYWVISTAQADFNAKTCSVTIAGYLSADSYNAGNTPSSRRPFFFSIPFTSLPSVGTDGSISMQELYDAVVAQINDPKRAVPSPLAGATEVA